MTATTPPEGLRARKRAAAQAAIEKVALALALEHGYERVTVDMICEAAEVSQRTFFNYFGTKERVILGVEPDPMPDAAAQAFIAGPATGILPDLVRGISSAMLSSQSDMTLIRSRFRIVTRSPELMTKQLELMTTHEGRLTELVLTRLQASGRTGEVAALREEASLTVSLALNVLRFVLQKQLAQGGSGAGLAFLDTQIEQALALVGRITRDS